MNMCGSLCVSWMGGQRDLTSSIFEVALECPEDLPFSILAQRPHKELGPQKSARPEIQAQDTDQMSQHYW